uniref:Integrase core domain containing protein n=1 Tax=Solanum tuberosum TaxID=4113 RepID=M1DD08_SOLTU
MKADFSSLKNRVNSHTDAIKLLEGQLSQLSAQLEPKVTGEGEIVHITTLVEDGDTDLAVVTRSGKVVVGDMNGNDEAQTHEEEKAVASVSYLMCRSEPLEAVLANYDESKIQGYYEVVATLLGLRECSKTPLKLDIDLKNRENLPDKPSREEPPKLELKVLPAHL